MNQSSTRIFKNAAAVLLFAISAVFFTSCNGDDNPVKTSEITVSPDSLGFGIVSVGSFKLLTVTLQNNTGTNTGLTLDFANNGHEAFSIFGDENVSIDANSSVVVNVRFAPLSGGDFEAVLKIGTEAEVKLTGSGVESDLITYSPAELDFAGVLVDVPKKKGISIENISSHDIELELKFEGNSENAFSIEDGAGNINLKKNEIKEVTVIFTPQDSKSFQASLLIDTIAVIPLSGSGLDKLPIITSPSDLDFGDVDAGTTVEKMIIIQNQANDEIPVSPEIVSDGQGVFEITELPAETLAAGMKDTVKVSFTPADTGYYNASLYIDESKTVEVPLTGHGLRQPDLEFSDNSLEFGNVETGNQKSMNITITNLTNQNVSVSSALSSNVFAIMGNSSFDIAAGSEKILSIQFEPDAAGSFDADILFSTSNLRQYEVALSGTGLQGQAEELRSASVSTGPVLDGEIDGIWNSAQEINVQLEPVQFITGGDPFVNAVLRSVNDGEYIYFLAEIEDDTKNDMPNRLVFNGGDPSDDANWTLTSDGQDGFAIMFPITESVTGHKGDSFDDAGCYTACHTAKFITTYESGMYPASGKIDIWYWKSGTTNPQGYADDYFADGAREKRMPDMTGKSFSVANFRDPEIASDLKPINMAGGDNGGLNPELYLWMETAQKFDAESENPATGASWAADDAVPGWQLRVPENFFDEGYRGDVEAAGVYRNGKWIIEIKRKLDTETSGGDDVLLSKGQNIPVSIAFFNDTRKYADFQYRNLSENPKPQHWGLSDYVINLVIE